MKTLKSALLLLVLGCVATSAAWADRSHGHYEGSRVRLYVDPWPLVFPPIYSYGGPRYYPYDYPYARYSEVIVRPAEPTVYIEQNAPQSNAPPSDNQAAPQSNDWYYCHKPDGYYPYVKSCPGGWQRVPAQPVPARP